ncbi:CBASS cGAMP synthase [Enterovibrio norvegicus]|uniref:CBASS cGAMP synthase n=1 Tax=Enterovibrio norvegicus TaxID=188144 RepID=UPI0013D3B0C4|nr:hypothetical protein [Enterovibrio norvegicus]
MTWNFHHYYTNKTEGLIGKLRLDKNEEDRLYEIRDTVRLHIRKVFEEAKKIANLSAKQRVQLNSVMLELNSTELRLLSFDERMELAQLISQMDDETKDEFAKLSPRFWTQGSIKYDTLNRPFHPGQEMDIDDGTYMPMVIFESEPKVGHSLLLLLVDSALKSLVAQNDGWKFEAKQTCGRIKIAKEKIHIDVPMYAIPIEQFLQKEKAILKANRRKHFLEAVATEDAAYESYEVDTKSVNLALRNGEKKWLNSDPKTVEDWFDLSCARIGRKHLPKVCRYMKAWRDAQWEVGGPSSICLMAAIVNVLDTQAHDKEDLDATMKVIADNLYKEFAKGIDSPDHSDSKPLFRPIEAHEKFENEIMAKLETLPVTLQKAEYAASKEDALRVINSIFGNRVTNAQLIVSKTAAPAFKDEPERSSSASTISSTMVSG